MTQLFITRLWELVHNNGHSSIRADELEILRDKCDGPGVDEVFTSAEWTVIQVVYPLSELHRIYLEKSGGEHGQKGANRFIREIFKVIANRFEEGRNYLSAYISNERDGCSPLTDNLHTPHWEYFHAVFSNLELYKLTLAVFNFVVAENQKQGKEAFVDPKWMENEVSQYMDACNFMTTACHQSAGRLRSTLTGDIALRGLQEAVLGAAGDTKDAVAHELRAFDNIPAMVKICEDIQASWIDALDGIIRTNIA
ncbi:hypothetical protein MMC21_004068 [Puttea exsequens]|nr:hypothetical protein [Puttea exsequens]